MILLGTDEAGYGPSLGPLVVTATVWSTPTDDLTELGRALAERGIRIGDSKKLYHGGGSLEPLEFGVWTAHLSADKTNLGVEMNSDDPCFRNAGPFGEIPPAVDRRRLEKSAETFRSVLDSFGVRLLRVRSLVLGVESFNRRLDACDSKGTLLSDATLEIVAEILNAPEYRPDGAVVHCDKHGGRNRYLDVLNKHFRDDFFQVVEESRPLSVYRSKKIEFRFQSKGESLVPVALASMFSKYLRELFMRRFNEFWRRHLPELQPTAGYPEDAKRFEAAIADVQKKLGIGDEKIRRRK